MRIGPLRARRPSPATLRSGAAAATGGLLLYAAFPPIGLWFLAPLGPALLILAVRGRRARSAFTAGGIFGTASFAPPLSEWLGVWPEVSLGVPVLVGLALSLRHSRRTQAAPQSPASAPEHDQPFTNLLS
ncbi:hypothetical protein AS200_14680 [Streptomyces sp. CdTB01]|nr:hypothetical protein AS200_14680 [Streptomyces sp. CdTB01]